MFGGRYLRQRTALGSESTALQTETTLGLPTGEKRRICGKNVINLLICRVFPALFGKYFIGLFRLKIQRMHTSMSVLPILFLRKGKMVRLFTY